MKKKVIIFYLDGVIFNSIEIAEKFLSLSFPGLTPQMQKELLVGNFHEGLKSMKHLQVEETQEEKEFRLSNYSKEKSEAPIYAGIKEMLVKLHSNGHIIALNTSAYSNNCLPLLQKTEIGQVFDFIGTAEVSKNKIDKFKIIKEKYGVENDEMLFVTDTLGDLREADVAGVPTVCVTWGAHDETYFLREPHENLSKIVHSVSELESFIEG